MAITAFKTFINGEVLLASDLNSSLTTIINEVNVHGGEIDTINGSTQGRSRNLIINGDFSVWQRGTSFTVNEYTSDRFQSNNVGTTHVTTQQTHTLGQTNVPGNPEFYSRSVTTSSAGTGNFSYLEQRIERSATAAGQEVTLSFYAKADSSKNIATEFTQEFGSGGSPSGPIRGIGSTTHALTTSWQRFTVTVTPTSVTGKTIGTAGDDYIRLLFWFDAGSNFDSRTNSLGQQSGTFDISNVQLEFGDTATEFEYVTPADQLARCQRYFEAINYASGSWLAVAQAFSTTVSSGEYSYKAKRGTPSLAVTGAGSIAALTAAGSSSAGGTLAFSAATSETCVLTITGATGLVAGNASCIGVITGAVVVEIDAEL